MADGNILSDFGIDLLEEEIDDVIFQTNEFLTDATFTGSQGPFWWILQMCMALAALFAIIMAAGMAYKMMVKHEPLDVMKLFRPLAVSLILCWWYPPADTGMANSGSNWCFLDFLSYIPNCVGSYTHDLYEAEASQISDKFEEVQELIYVRDTMYTALQAQADVAHTGTSDPNLIEATMEQTGVDEVTNMEKDAAKLWFTSLTSGVIVGIDKIIMLIASGKSRALLPPSPLRTVRESFPSYGSSNSIFLFVVRNRLILSTFSFISLVAVVVDKLPYNRTTNRYFVDVPCFCTVYFLAT